MLKRSFHFPAVLSLISFTNPLKNLDAPVISSSSCSDLYLVDQAIHFSKTESLIAFISQRIITVTGTIPDADTPSPHNFLHQQFISIIKSFLANAVCFYLLTKGATFLITRYFQNNFLSQYYHFAFRLTPF